MFVLDFFSVCVCVLVLCMCTEVINLVARQQLHPRYVAIAKGVIRCGLVSVGGVVLGGSVY